MKIWEQQQLHAYLQRLGPEDDLRPNADPWPALDKLTTGAELDDADAVQLESLVLRSARPIVRVEQGRLATPPGAWSMVLAHQTSLIERCAASVFKIGVTSEPCVGSGFLVGDRLLMTTRTVAGLFTTGLGRRDVSIRSELNPSFVLRADGVVGMALGFERVELIHPFLDLALLRIPPVPLGTLPAPLQLTTTALDEGDTRQVGVIGHIDFRSGESVAADALFDARGGKHFSPGALCKAAIFESHGHRMWALSHDCSTTPGSIGGPLIDIETGVVLGMHVSGSPLRAGMALPMSEILRDKHVARALEMDGPWASVTAWRDYWSQVDPAEAVPEVPAARPGWALPVLQRQVLRGQLETTFGTVDAVVAFLQTQGYGAVIDAVPRGSSNDRQYLDALIRAMARRGNLDESFFEALRKAEGVASVAAPELRGSIATEAATDPPVRSVLLRSPQSASPSAQPSVQRAGPNEHSNANVSYFAAGEAASRAVVLVEIQVAQGATSGTGWLLTPQLVVVAAFMVAGTGPITGNVRYDFDAPGQSGVACPLQSCELFAPQIEVALLRLAQPLHERAGLRLATRPPTGAIVTAIHHPMNGPKQLSFGNLLAYEERAMRYSLDTSPGSAGAPIFDTDWRVLGTHQGSHQDRTQFGAPASALLQHLRELEGVSSPLWREVAAAQPDLKIVDRALYTQLTQQPADALVSMIIEVLDASVALSDVPDLKIRTTSRNIVTAVGSRASVDALAEHEGVLAVQASSATGVTECAMSVPRVGAAQIHVNQHELGDAALIAVIDNGVDIFHKCLLDDTGRTRIVAFWDQKDRRAERAEFVSPEGEALVDALDLKNGALYLQQDLQNLIDGSAQLPPTYPRAANMAHGTTVCSIAAGRRTGNSAAHFSGGVAPAASLVVVRYDLQGQSIGSADSHIDALRFIDRLATRLDKPVVVNISNGMNAGAHDGSSPVEQVCQEFLQNGQARGRVIVKSAGNERLRARHAMLWSPNGAVSELRWRSRPNGVAGGRVVPEIIELWFNYLNSYQFRVKAPSGDWSPPMISEPLQEYLPNGNYLEMTHIPIHPSNGDAHLKVSVAPGRISEVEAGDWTLEITALTVKNKSEIHAWIEEVLNRDLHFLDYLREEVTVTLPGTAADVITVGAIETAEAMRPFKLGSLGPTRKGREKPELVAPGVALRAARATSGDGIDSIVDAQSGTSFAAPHVAGAIALVMSARKKAGKQQLTAHQTRAVLIETLRHFSPEWHEHTGYGELDADAFFIRAMSIP